MAARSRLGRVLRVLGAVFGALALLVFFTYLNFPVAAVVDRYQGDISRALGAKVDFSELSTYRFSGVQARAITLTLKPKESKDEPSSGARGEVAGRASAATASAKPDARRGDARGNTALPDLDGPTLTLKDVRARVGILPFLFSKKLALSAGFKVGDGDVDVEFGKAPDKWALKGDVKGVLLERLAVLQSLLGVEPKGALGARIDLSGPVAKADKAPGAIRWADTAGKIEVHVSPFQLPTFDYKYKLPGENPGDFVEATQKIPAMTLTPLAAVLEVEAGTVFFMPDKVNIKSPDVEVSVKGVMRLQNVVKETSYDLWITFRFTDSFVKANQILTMLPSIGNFKSAYNSSTKSYGFRVRGTFARSERVLPAPTEPFGLMPPRAAKPAGLPDAKR